ncbi:MAG: TlpA disulfide reductase family protein [Fimbriimonadaceae bacterium]
MKRFFLSSFIVLALSVSAFAQEGIDPNKVMQEVNAYYSQLIADARASKEPINANDLMAKRIAKIEETLKTVDIAKIEAKDAYAWARLYQSAKRDKECCDLVKRYLETKPADADRFQAMLTMAQSCNNLGESQMLTATLNEIPVPTSMNYSLLTSYMVNQFVDTILEKDGLDAALKILNTVEAKIVTEDPKDYAKRMNENRKRAVSGGAATITNPNSKAKTEQEYLAEYEATGAYNFEARGLQFDQKRAEMLNDAGRKKEAVEILGSAIAKLSPKNPALRGAKSTLTQLTLVGSMAPALTVERFLTKEFASLEALKGKVVIVDFFAHWCGPCIASFPDMKKMYADLHDKGLEVVGVTTYYGYYKQENVAARDMPRDTEFAKMGEFLKEHQLPWSVVYGERTNFEPYGISGIPTAILIDKEGKVHEIKVGYSKETFAHFREEVEKLLGGSGK